MRTCARCGQVVPFGRRKYCSDGCADEAAHAQRLVRLSKGQMRPAKFRFYPKQEKADA